MIQQAIAELYKNEIFNAICVRYGRDNHEDLKGIIILMLLEMPQPKLEHIIQNNYLVPFSLQMTRNQASQDKKTRWSQFNKQFSNTQDIPIESIYQLSIDINDTDDYQSKEVNYRFAERVAKKIKADSMNQSNKYFYHARLVIEKAKHRNIKQLSRVTGIPYDSMRFAIREYKIYLKQWAMKLTSND